METFMQKFLQVVKPASQNLPVPKIKIEEQELFQIQEFLLELNNLVSYEDNDVLKNKKVLKDAINQGMFFEQAYAVGTTQYDSLLAQYKDIKDLEYGECLAFKDLSKTKQCFNELQTVFRKEEDGVIRQYTRLMPFMDVQPDFMPKYHYNALQKVDNVVQEGEALFVQPPNQDECFSCLLKDDQLMVLGYDIRRNPFKNKHFRVFNEKGEIADILKLDYAYLIKRIRAAEAHHKVYSYFNGKPYGGKVVPLGNGSVALFSNRWHEFLMRTAHSTLNKQTNEFHLLCAPHAFKPIKTDADCIERIDNIRKIKVTTSKMIDSTYGYAWLKKIVENYESSPVKNKTIQEYFDTHAQKWLGNCVCKIEPLGNTQLIKSRLVGDTAFYNIDGHDKENAVEQNRFMKYLLAQVYENAYTTSEGILPNGKIQPIHVNLQTLSLFIRAELPRLHNLTGVLKGSKWQKQTAQYAGIEKQLAIPVLCAYKNLIRNHFVDDVSKYSQAPAGFALKGEQLEGKRSLTVLNMDMFEMYKNNRKGEVEIPKTFEQKVDVLRAVRNAISHNRVHVQFNKNCNLNESKYVFDMGEYSKVRVNISKFEEFVNQPLFSDHKSLEKYTIKAKDTKQLKEFMKKICQNEITYGRDNEWVDE